MVLRGGERCGGFEEVEEGCITSKEHQAIISGIQLPKTLLLRFRLFFPFCSLFLFLFSPCPFVYLLLLDLGRLRGEESNCSCVAHESLLLLLLPVFFPIQRHRCEVARVILKKNFTCVAFQ
jgi:hypothetical protein